MQRWVVLVVPVVLLVAVVAVVLLPLFCAVVAVAVLLVLLVAVVVLLVAVLVAVVVFLRLWPQLGAGCCRSGRCGAACSRGARGESALWSRAARPRRHPPAPSLGQRPVAGAGAGAGSTHPPPGR